MLGASSGAYYVTRENLENMVQFDAFWCNNNNDNNNNIYLKSNVQSI